MAVQRFINAATTTTDTTVNRNSDMEDDSSSSMTTGDLNASVNSSNNNGHSSRNSMSTIIISSPLSSKSKSKFARERLALYEQQPQQLRLSSKNMNRHHTQLSIFSSHRTIMAGMLLCCVAFLSFTMNWNDMLAQRQQSTLLLPLESHRDETERLSLIPSIDELATGVSALSLREEIARRKAATRIASATSIKAEHTTDKIEVSPEIDYSMNRPPLNTIINDRNEIIGDPEWLLDFAILGYGKCGTSSIMYWLREHPEIQAFGREKGHFMSRKPGLMVRQLYEVLEPGPYQRGYKAPQDVTQIHILNYYRTYWPKAKLILGIRHPIRWFESLYNFRIQNLRDASLLPHPNNLIGPCRQGRYLTCTNKGDFAYSLLKLGQQNYPKPRPATELELSIAERYNRTVPFDSSTVEYMYNPIFLFELDQLSDSNATRDDLFRSDFTKFMGLKEPLPALPHFIPGMPRETEEQIQRDAMKIKICDDEYIPVRNELMVLARSSSQWIREVFLNAPTVHVSSKEYFISILEGWMKDPCDDMTSLSDASTEATKD